MVEDDPIQGRLFRCLLAAQGITAYVARDLARARRLVSERTVGLVLLDRLLGEGSDGMRFCLELKKDPRRRFIPVIVLTGLEGFEEEVRGYRYGADLYLHKPVRAAELLGYVKGLLGRLPYREELGGRISFGELTLDLAGRTLWIGGRPFGSLPRRQFQLLALLMASRGRTVSRETIVKRLWKNAVRDKDVDVLVLRLRRRLGRHAGLVASVPSVGYRLLA